MQPVFVGRGGGSCGGREVAKGAAEGRDETPVRQR